MNNFQRIEEYIFLDLNYQNTTHHIALKIYNLYAEISGQNVRNYWYSISTIYSFFQM